MRFSIIMPTMGKRPDFLRKSIESILSQDFTDFELIVKSGDCDLDLPADPRIRHIRLQDKNLGEALNQGFKAAKGEILNESNDDDLMAPGTLSFVDKAIGEAMWLYGRIKYGSDFMGEPWDFNRLKRSNFVPQPAVFFKREAFQQTDGFDEANPLAADYDMWLQLGSKFEPVFTDRVLAFYTTHEGQLTNTAQGAQLAHAHNVRQKYL